MPVIRAMRAVAVRQPNDTFSYNHSKGWRWVQRLCFYLLRKIGCECYIDQVIRHEEFVFNEGNLCDFLAEHLDSIISQYGFPERGKFLLGRKEARHYINSVATDYPFSVQWNPQRISVGGSMYYMGIQIITVPWMEGAIFIPDKLLKNDNRAY